MTRRTARSTPRGSVIAAGAAFALIAGVALLISLQGSPTFSEPRLGSIDVTAPAITMDAAPAVSEPPPDATSGAASGVLSVIATVLGVLLGAVLVFFVTRAIIRALRARTPRRAGAAVAGGTHTGDAQSEPDAQVVARAADEAVLAFDRERAADDAVVAAWVILERTAAEAGLVRGPSETAAEFTVRIIGRRAGVATATAALLRAYEDVRFGGHRPDEAERSAVRAHLITIREMWR